MQLLGNAHMHLWVCVRACVDHGIIATCHGAAR